MKTDRKILIDNATLSGIERITGRSKILNLNNIDNDILCLERLVTAILFSDRLIAIDDYKNEFRSKRMKNFDFISFSKMDESIYSRIADDAASFARGMTFSFQGTKPTGDVVSFFESLRIDPQLRWNVWVSSEYLTLSYLVKDSKHVNYETSIDSIFRNEDSDRELVSTGTDYQPNLTVMEHPEIRNVKDLIHTFSSNNPQFKAMDDKSALNRVIFGYGWAAERSYFYNAMADMEEANVCLAPLRDAFCESCCRIDYPSQVNGLLDSLKKKSQETLFSILEPSGHAKFAMRLPFFTAYLISKTDTPEQCIDLALSLRNTRQFQECRIIFHNMDYLSPANRIKEINGIMKYLNQSCAELMKKYAISTEGGVQSSLSIGLSGVDFNIESKISQLFRSYKYNSFSRVFRNIAQDMLNVERLGGLYRKLCSSIHEHKDANHPRISTTPKYMESKTNEYGRPAK